MNKSLHMARETLASANASAKQAHAFLSAKYHKLEAKSHSDVIVTGLRDHFWGDLYHHALTISWLAFLGWSILFFLGVNLSFSLLYAMAPQQIANIRPGHFEDFFFFSIQTFSTVGYGGMTPVGAYANTIVSLEVFIAIMINSLGTGLIFARFSRPTARVLFSDKAVINIFDATQTLNIRIANCRRSVILSMDMEMALSRLIQVGSGRYVRRFDPLPLVQAHSPLLRFTTIATHVIDATSPLHNIKLEDLKRDEAEIIITVTGIDEVTSQSIFARTAYNFEKVLHGHHFVDIIGMTKDGRLNVDFSRFHHTEDRELPDAVQEQNSAR
ncbi:ion channel [Beijerinckia indica]|uniref:K channel inward rectifier conserved region 2 domain protein n=1 Tax=Beijerinckia indica subsp. indica (strain ATCC 9039 / DSM 1715 / NCIMB 8712) TaxID=395963 RepID=B2IDA8_BEII9|nr:ion channel [Beijerinckia indica]ACB93965.1 K channel inward rectifier conserved region 2 domain protein [Beijerinckia indica subsp. indica ATCC 9039]